MSVVSTDLCAGGPSNVVYLTGIQVNNIKKTGYKKELYFTILLTPNAIFRFSEHLQENTFHLPVKLFYHQVGIA